LRIIICILCIYENCKGFLIKKCTFFEHWSSSFYHEFFVMYRMWYSVVNTPFCKVILSCILNSCTLWNVIHYFNFNFCYGVHINKLFMYCIMAFWLVKICKLCIMNLFKFGLFWNLCPPIVYVYLVVSKRADMII
jgi:hypothetical protein